MPVFATVHFRGFAYAPEDDTFERMERDGIAIKCSFTLQAARTVHVECTAAGRCVDMRTLCRHQGGVRRSPNRRPKGLSRA
eukprot:5535404-Pyramimonas_sp.AAC.1